MGRDFSRVGVIGLGTMGAGIVEVFARNGIDVVAVEVNDDAVRQGEAHLRHSTDRAVSRGKLAEQDQQALHGRVRFTVDLAELAGCQLVVEAVPEHLELKKRVFAEVDAIVDADAILATNTSSLSVTQIAVATSGPSRVVGMHFFNPAPVLQLVEVIRTVITEEAVVADITALAERLGKKPVVVGDKAGFIANALLFGYLNHAASMYETKYASREDIDAAMRLGCGLPLGPLALLDLIGLDTAYEILDTMHEQGRDRLHAPSPIIKQLVSAGLTGRKSGRGFYSYAEPASSKVVEDALTPRPRAAGEPALRSVGAVGVVGSGTMAAGIVAVFARAGYDVTSVAEPQEAALGDLSGVDLVVVAVAGDRQVERDLFARLDAVCKPGAILATSTSSLPVVDCASATTRPEDVVGMHFVGPAQGMSLVEVVSTVSTGQDVAATVVDLCARLGTHPVRCSDRPGFIVNALLFPYLNDAVKMLEAHYASTDDIDTAMTSGCGYPVGPFELLDAFGLDVALAIQRRLYLDVREPGLAAAPLLEQLVAAGRLGREAGRGFRAYD